MPGYNQYLIVESDAKMLANMLPGDPEDVSVAVWAPIGETTMILRDHLNDLAKATNGSQRDLAVELSGTAQQLATVMSNNVLRIETFMEAEREKFLAGANADDRDNPATQALADEKAHDYLARVAPEVATTRGAVRGFIDQVHRFDEAKLKRPRFIFG